MEVLIYNFVFILILGLLLKANTQYSRGKIKLKKYASKLFVFIARFIT